MKHARLALARSRMDRENHPAEKKPGEMPGVFASFERRETREPPESMHSRERRIFNVERREGGREYIFGGSLPTDDDLANRIFRVASLPACVTRRDGRGGEGALPPPFHRSLSLEVSVS